MSSVLEIELANAIVTNGKTRGLDIFFNIFKNLCITCTSTPFIQKMQLFVIHIYNWVLYIFKSIEQIFHPPTDCS